MRVRYSQTTTEISLIFYTTREVISLSYKQSYTASIGGENGSTNTVVRYNFYSLKFNFWESA
jgi:hypothetical protein